MVISSPAHAATRSAERGDRASFERELRWVLAQDPRKTTGDPYPWNVYFQREACQLLAAADAIF